MARFRVKAGRYVGKGGRVYKQGDIVESHVDLVTIGGSEKFERLDGKPSASRNQFPVTPGSTSAPGGQVHSGKQQTGARDEDGNPISGPMKEETDPATEEALNPDGEEGAETDGEGQEPTEGAEPAEGAEGAEEGAGADEQPNFDGMTIKQLKDYAAEKEVDVAGAKTKADLVKKLKGE